MSAPPRDPIPTLSSLDLVIDTERLRLRPYTEADAEALWPYVSDPELPRLMTWAAHADPGVTLSWVRSRIQGLADGTAMTWIIELAGEVVGTVGLDGISWQVAAVRVDQAELGYWLAARVRQRGLMTEAARAATRFGFEVLGLHRITVGAFAENAASRRVIEKIGFRSTGRRPDDLWRDGRWYDHERFELIASEWAALPK